MMPHAFVSIGSNIAPAENVRAAIRHLGQRNRLLAISTVYRTAALERPEQPPYYNCVVKLETGTEPLEMKHQLRQIEEALGRRRTADKYAARTIDLDLIAYDDLTLDTVELKLPDPDILERPFLAVPLWELTPELYLPGLGLPIREIAARLPKDGMEPLQDYTEQIRKESIRGHES